MEPLILPCQNLRAPTTTPLPNAPLKPTSCAVPWRFPAEDLGPRDPCPERGLGSGADLRRVTAAFRVLAEATSGYRESGSDESLR